MAPWIAILDATKRPGIHLYRGGSMVREYLGAAMESASYEILSDDAAFYGEIPGFEGVYAHAATLEQCRRDLEEVLEEWVLFRVSRNLPLPPAGVRNCGSRRWVEVPPFGPISRRELVRALGRLGYDGPYSGGRHQFMVRDVRTVRVPNPHGGDVGVELLARILRQAGVSRAEWEQV